MGLEEYLRGSKGRSLDDISHAYDLLGAWPLIGFFDVRVVDSILRSSNISTLLFLPDLVTTSTLLPLHSDVLTLYPILQVLNMLSTFSPL